MPRLLGSVRNRLPWIELTIEGVRIEFVLDTGFDGEPTLPNRLIRSLGLTPIYTTHRMLADGTIREYRAYEAEIAWAGEDRIVEIVELEGNPLFGNSMIEGWLISVLMEEGGEVALEATY